MRASPTLTTRRPIRGVGSPRRIRRTSARNSCGSVEYQRMDALQRTSAKKCGAPTVRAAVSPASASASGDVCGRGASPAWRMFTLDETWASFRTQGLTRCSDVLVEVGEFASAWWPIVCWRRGGSGRSPGRLPRRRPSPVCTSDVAQTGLSWNASGRGDQARSKRSASITLANAAAKSSANLAPASSAA